MSSKKQIDERLKKLQDIPLFKAFVGDNESLEKINSICKIKHFDKDAVILSEGGTGDDLYIVFEGSVEIRKNTRSGDEYTVVQLNADHNVFFGELAIVSEGERSATVIAKSDSVFLTISKHSFEHLCDTDPRIGLQITKEILKTIALRLRKTNDDMLTIFDALVHEIRNS